MCAHVSHSGLHSDMCGLPLKQNVCKIMRWRKNFDALIKSIDYLKKTQAGDQQDLWKRLDQLKEVVVIGQEGATQLVIKKLKEDQTFTFKKKENEKQFIFNDNVKD